MQENEGSLPETKKARFQSETIKGLVILFYKNLLVYSPRQFTTAYMLTRTLAKRFKTEKYIKQLDFIYTETRIGYPLALIQTITFRDLMMGSNTNKSYNYGHQTRVVRLGDMIIALDNSLVKILDIFTDICVEHDIDPVFIMPMFEGMSMDKSAL